MTPEAAGIVTPAVLGQIGRSLCRDGESIWLIDFDDGDLQLLPAGFVDVYGSARPSTWRYRLSMYGPQTTTRLLEPGAVVHCMYAYRAIQPWRGLSPLEFACASGALVGNVEAAAGNEAGGPHGSVIPAPEGTSNVDDLKTDLFNLRGGLGMPESMGGGWADKGGRPDADWKQRRIGFEPPPGLVTLRTEVRHDVLAACGVGVPLATGTTDGTAMRESYRRFLHSTIRPVARLVEAELTAKLEIPVTLDFAELGAADVAGRARGFKALTEAGLDSAAAARIVAFDLPGNE